MAQQQFYQPQKRRRENADDGNIYDPPAPLQGVNEQSARVSQQARETVNNIDDTLRDAEQGASFYRPEAGDNAGEEEAKALPGIGGSPDEKSESEPESEPASTPPASGAEGRVGNGFNLHDPLSKAAILKALLSRNKRKALFGAGIGGGVTGLIILGFFILIPLKIENVVTDLEGHFSATTTSAVQQETDSLFNTYVRQKVLPGYSKCGSTIDKSCSALASFGTDPISRLYNDWRNNRFEQKLATNYGIEFRRNADNSWSLKAPGSAAAGDNIGPNGENLDNVFNRTDRAGMRQAIRDATANESLWKRTFIRFKTGTLLQSKYGIRRCLIFCKLTDPIAKNIADQKVAAKLFLVQRVITPRNASLGIAIQCILNPQCDPTDKSKTSGSPDENGKPTSATDEQIKANFQSLAQASQLEDATALETHFKGIEEDGLQKYLTKQLLSTVLGQDLAGTAADKVPIVGWINLAATIVNAANGANGKIKALSYAINAASAVQLFSMYQTYADEIHTGHVTATEVGSMVSSLGPGDNSNPNDPESGGTASAENTPLYANLIGDNSSPTTSAASLLGSLLPGKAFAASTNATTTSNTYICNNGRPVPAGQQVCNEEVLGSGNGAAKDVYEFLHTGGLSLLSYSAKLWGYSGEKLFNFVGSLLGKAETFALSVTDIACKAGFLGTVVGDVANPTMPGYCSFKKALKQLEPQIATAVSQWVIPSTISDNMSGGRTFDVMAAGADVDGSDTAHTVLGGQELNPVQTAEITNQQQNEAEQDFARQPFFARMFSTQTQYSLVSRIAMDIPIDFQGSMERSFASLISNPFSVLGHSLASIFSTKVSADVPAQPDPFNVPQYGYPAGTIPADSQAYWNQNCKDGADGAQTQAWNAVAALSVDHNTGQPVNTTVNPCLLIENTVESVGGAMDSSLISPTDLSETGVSQP